jgi:NTP pyrophosphatase (non-canonical NTP hydrolase)
MLRPDYLSKNLTSPIPTKDGGTLRTIGEACEYMSAIGKEREQRRHWQQVRELMLQEADWVRILALLIDQSWHDSDTAM